MSAELRNLTDRKSAGRPYRDSFLADNDTRISNVDEAPSLRVTPKRNKMERPISAYNGEVPPGYPTKTTP